MKYEFIDINNKVVKTFDENDYLGVWEYQCELLGHKPKEYRETTQDGYKIRNFGHTLRLRYKKEIEQ